MGCFNSKLVEEHAVESGRVKSTPTAWGSPVGGVTPQGDAFSPQVHPLSP
jgi:hypothetical protein